MEMIDIVAPKGVQVQVSADGKKLWVNINGVCALRCSQVEVMDVEDMRPFCDGCGFQECAC